MGSCFGSKSNTLKDTEKIEKPSQPMSQMEVNKNIIDKIVVQNKSDQIQIVFEDKKKIQKVIIKYPFPVLFSAHTTLNLEQQLQDNSEEFVALSPALQTTYHLDIKRETDDYSFIKKYLVLINLVDINNENSLQQLNNLLKFHQDKECKSKFVIIVYDNSEMIKSFKQSISSNYPNVIFEIQKHITLTQIQQIIITEFTEITNKILNFTFTPDIDQLQDFVFAQQYEYYSNLLFSYPSGLCSQPIHYGDIFFRCYDCELYTHESIFVLFCENCFRNGNHKNHRISIRYQEDQGIHGCCDCGDTAAFNESSFCKNHDGGQQLQREVFKDFGGDVYSRLLGVISKGFEIAFDENARSETKKNLNSLIEFIQDLIQETPAMKMIISALLMEEKSILGVNNNTLEMLFKNNKLIDPNHQDQLQALFIELFMNKQFKKYLAQLYGKYFKKIFSLKNDTYKQNSPLQITFPNEMTDDKSELDKLIAPIIQSNKVEIIPCLKFSSLITQFLSPDIQQSLMSSDYLGNYLKIFQKLIILTYSSEEFNDLLKQFVEFFFFQLDTISTKRMVLKNTQHLRFISEFLRILGKIKYFEVKNTELCSYVEFLALKEFNEYLFCQLEIDSNNDEKIKTFEKLALEIVSYFKVFQNQTKCVPFALIRSFSIMAVHYINLFGHNKVVEIIKKIIPQEQLTQVFTELFEHIFLINIGNYIMRNNSMKISQQEIIEILRLKYEDRVNFAFINEGFSSIIYNNFMENYDICFLQFCFFILEPMNLLQLMANSLKIFEKRSIYMILILLEILTLLNLEELAFLNCLCYPQDHPYTESNLSSMKFLLINLLFSQQNKLHIQNIESIGRRIFKFDMDYAFFLEELTTMNKESKALMLKEEYLQEIEPMQFQRFNFIQSPIYEELQLKVKKHQDKFDLVLTTKTEKFIDKNLLNLTMGYKIYSNQMFFTLWEKIFQDFEDQVLNNCEQINHVVVKIIIQVLKIQSLILMCYEINNEVIANDNLIRISNQLKSIQKIMSKFENQEEIVDYKQTVHKLLTKVEKLNQFNKSMHFEIQDFSTQKTAVQKNYLKKQQDILKQFQTKQNIFCEKNEEAKLEMNNTEIQQETDIKCQICRVGNNVKEKLGICAYLGLDNLTHFYSPEFQQKGEEEDLEANKIAINWVMTTCNHFSHSDCAFSDKSNYEHMLKNEAERVCSFCKSLFNILLPVITEDFEFPIVKVNEEQKVVSYSIEQFEKFMKDQEFFEKQLLVIKEQKNYSTLCQKNEWFKNQIQNIILINISELNQDNFIEIKLPFENSFVKNIKESLLFQFNQMFVKGVNLYLRNHHFFIRNLFLCYCSLFEPNQKILISQVLLKLNQRFQELKTGEFLKLSLDKYEQFISSILIDLGMLFLHNQQLYFQSIGLVYHLFTHHLNQVYKYQLEQSDLQGINNQEQLQNYILPFKRQIIGIILCCQQFDQQIIQDIVNLELMIPLEEANKYEQIFNTLFTIPEFQLSSPCNLVTQILSCNPCKQPQLQIQLPEVFLDFHQNFLLKRCMLCEFYSKKNMGFLCFCLICGLRFCTSCEQSKYIQDNNTNPYQILYAHANAAHLGTSMFVNCQTGRLLLVDRKHVYEYGQSLYVNSCGAPIKLLIKVFQNTKNWELFKLDTKRINFFEHAVFSRKLKQQFGQEIAEKPPQHCSIF